MPHLAPTCGLGDFFMCVWTRVGSCKVRRDHEIELVLSEHRQWRQHSVGTDRLAALRLYIGGDLHQEWMSDVVILPRSLGNSSWS